MSNYSGICFFVANSEKCGPFKVIILENGDIKFDCNDYYDNQYTVVLKNRQGSYYKGEAFCKSGEKITVAARVYRDEEAGLIFIAGSEWRENGVEYNWFVNIEYDD